MIEVPSPTGHEANVLAVHSYTGLHLEPPTRDVVSLDYDIFFFNFDKMIQNTMN